MRISTAYRGLMHHSGRTLLTMLGIIIGIAAIICTFAIGRGAQEKVRRQILSIGSNYISLNTKHLPTRGKSKNKRKRAIPLTTQDALKLAKMCPYIHYISPGKDVQAHVTYYDTAIDCRMRCGNEQFLTIIGRSINTGSFFSADHVLHASPVIVLGDSAATTLFEDEDPLGKTVFIKDVPYRVIGTLKPMTTWWGNQKPNLDIFIPFTTAQKNFFPARASGLQYIVISALDTSLVAPLTRMIRRILRAQHNLSDGYPDDFQIWDQNMMAHAAKESSHALHLFILIAASISLIVGGIGVMNIMLVCVSERTREIGIRRALGATKKDIKLQFLIEAIILCLIGGIIGIILGITIALIIPHVSTFSTVIEVAPILLSAPITIIIGIFFGFYPAYRAANLSPVTALQER